MKIKIPFFVLLVSFFACTSDTQKDPNALTTEKVTPAYIETLANSVYDEAAKKIDSKKAMDYVKACEFYAEHNPKDAKSPEWLLKAAETARNVSEHDRALKIYDNVLAKFPEYPKVAQAMFLKAFTLDDNMNKKEEAKVLYEEFITKYPNDDFAESAKFMLDNLFKSDAQIIEEFEKKRTESAEQ